MRPAAESPLVKRSLTLPEGMRGKLNLLRDSTEAASDSEIVRKALMYYEQLLEDHDRGRELFVRDAAGEEIIYPIGDETTDATTEAGSTFVRRHLILHEKSARRLDALRASTNAPSDSELVRAALALYEFLVVNALKGNRLVVRDNKSKRETEYFVPVSRAAEPRVRGRHMQILAKLRFG